MGTVNPLIRQLGLQQILQREAQAVPEFTMLDGEQTETALAGHVRTSWARNKLCKEKIERRMLNCLRARRGEYSAEALAQIQQGGGSNVVWADLTETKCRGASAWIREIVLPAGERPWGITPTPIPDMPLPIKNAVVAKAIKQAQAVMEKMATDAGVVMERSEFRKTVTELGDKLRVEAELELKKAAERRAKRMETVIADRLAQGGWEEAIDQFVEDFVTYPAAILKGPTYQRHKRLSWGEGFTPKVSDNPAQTWERVSPFDIYPSVGAVDCQRGDVIERIRFWRSELYDLKGLPGYQDKEIEKALIEYTAGHLEGWLWTEAERQRLEKETTYLFLSPPGVIDALNFYGSVPGWKLMSWGVQEDMEPDKDYEVNCLIVGRFVVYCALNPDPLGQRPYRKACYDEIPGAFWGRSIPDLVSVHQQMCNGCACSLADNMGLSAGPMGWVHIDRLADGEQSLEVAPFKMFQLKSDPTQGVNPGMGFFQATDNSRNLMQTMAEWEQKADDASGVPRYTYGNGEAAGAGDTASGLAMLMNNAAKGLRRAIGNIDMRVIAPTIGMAFTNEMLYNKDDSIKGDCIVVPRGANAILIKESSQARRTQFLAATANPVDLEIIGKKGRAALLREVAISMELPVDDIVPTIEQLDEQSAAAGQAEQEQMLQMQALEAKHLELETMLKTQSQIAIDNNKAQAASSAEQQKSMLAMVGEVVKQAMAAAHGEGKEKEGSDKPAGKSGKPKKKRIEFEHDDDGLIVAGEMEAD